MKILLITDDNEVINLITESAEVIDDKVYSYSAPKDSFELISNIFADMPGLIIYDNDFLLNDTIKIIQSIRKVNQSVPIIFISSEISLELGRQICPLGIHFSTLKPLSQNEISESIKSIKKLIAG